MYSQQSCVHRIRPFARCPMHCDFTPCAEETTGRRISWVAHLGAGAPTRAHRRSTASHGAAGPCRWRGARSSWWRSSHSRSSSRRCLTACLRFRGSAFRRIITAMRRCAASSATARFPIAALPHSRAPPLPCSRSIARSVSAATALSVCSFMAPYTYDSCLRRYNYRQGTRQESLRTAKL